MTLPMGRAMREIFGETVAALADDDPRIVMLDGDVGQLDAGRHLREGAPGHATSRWGSPSRTCSASPPGWRRWA